jgi:ZIP family zinc transporter
LAYALVSSVLAGLATGAGALLVVLFGRPSLKFFSAMLGFAAGIMLAISAFDLLPEAHALGGPVGSAVGLILGAGLMAGLDVIIPHIHKGSQNGRLQQESMVEGLDCHDLLKCGLFLVVGIALHNLPEGLAIGAGNASSANLGTIIAISLALHNVPEGMVTAAPLLLGGMEKWRVILLATIAGLMTPVGTLIGSLAFTVNRGLLGGALAFAAGAMVYIVSDELIPQSHRYHSHTANAGLLAGFVLVFILS